MRIRVGHVSLQFSDTDKQHTSDINRIFNRAVARRYAWITGTESGPGAGNTGKELVRIGKEHGYSLWVPSQQADGVASQADSWIAVRKDLIEGRMKKGFDFVIPGSGAMKDLMDIGDKSWAPKGVTHVTFESTNKDLGRVSIASAHYLTGAKSPKSPYWEWNQKLAEAIGDWAREQGKGPALVFYGGDQNMADDKNAEPQGDTFFGENLTSTWDELKKWENTGHGVIDVIATYNKDGRVKALNTTTLNDREFPLHTDHFFVEAVIEVDPIKKD